jgi:hypothetical protein
LRQEAGFRWSAGSNYLVLIELSGIPIRDFYLDPDACIETHRMGRLRLQELYGESVALPGLATPPVSYGHVNGLGAHLIFPEGGEVAPVPLYGSLAHGIEALKKPVDFSETGMARFYVEFRDRLQKAFPGESVGFGYGLEGPITTAYELRGQPIFYDLMDDPGSAQVFLELVTRSIHEFHLFRCHMLGHPPVNPDGGGLCDDVASNVPPRMFREVVLPVWEMYYSGITTGRRNAHVEDLRPDQLRFLEEIGLSHYDPSISHRLNPRIIRERTRVPFSWRLGNFHYRTMTCRDVEDFVFQAAADGASRVFTLISAGMGNKDTVKKVEAFRRAAQASQQMIEEGADRAEIAGCVSPEGRKRFWEHWPE